MHHGDASSLPWQHAVELIDQAPQHVSVVYRDNLRVLTLIVDRGMRLGLALRDAPLGAGVLVDDVAGHEALAAGLEPGDLVIAVDDELVRIAARTYALLERPGEVEIRVFKRN